MLLGNGAYANVEENISQLIWDTSYDGSEAPVANRDNLQGGGACINGTYDGVTYTGIIAGAIVNIGGDGIEDLEPNTSAYFFYAGTAPAPTILSFTLTPELGNNNYVITPRNKNSDGTKYNTITIGSTTTQKLYFTTPNILTITANPNIPFTTFSLFPTLFLNKLLKNIFILLQTLYHKKEYSLNTLFKILN